MAEEILIDVDITGNVTVAGKGIKGPDCVQLTKEIEQAIGVVQSRRKTAEYHERPPVKRQVKA